MQLLDCDTVRQWNSNSVSSKKTGCDVKLLHPNMVLHQLGLLKVRAYSSEKVIVRRVTPLDVIYINNVAFHCYWVTDYNKACL